MPIFVHHVQEYSFHVAVEILLEKAREDLGETRSTRREGGCWILGAVCVVCVVRVALGEEEVRLQCFTGNAERAC